jgi:two-component SAPR family response regulator
MPGCGRTMQPAKIIRVLVVEDEPLIGMIVENFLGDFGYSVVGPIENLKAAVLLAATEQVDVAVVDINIAGQIATAVADKLIEREIPFLFVSGYEKMRGTRYASIPFLRKPFTPEDLHEAVERVLRR